MVDTITDFRRFDFALYQSGIFQLFEVLRYGRLCNRQHLVDVSEKATVLCGKKSVSYTHLDVYKRQPDIVVAVLQFRIGFGRLTEPRMFVRRVARHEIQTDADAQVVGLADELHQLGIGAETRVDPVEIGDVVTAVLEFAPEDGAEPNGVRAQAIDVGQFGADAFQITDAVAVAVFEGGGVDVVKNPLFEPFGDLLCGCGQQEKRGCQCEKSA